MSCKRTIDVGADARHDHGMFTIALPHAGRRRSQDRYRQREQASAPGAANLPCARRVLLVDDSPPFRSVARELLGRRGYVVASEVDCAAAAMEAAALIAPDAGLIDVHLPDQNGFELAARLTHAHPALAVLLMSADYDDNFYALAEVSGARGFVPKCQLAQVELARFWPSSAPSDPGA